MDGMVRQEIRRDVIKPVPKKEEKQPMPVILIGHLDEALLFRKVPVFKTNRDRYQPNPEILDQIKEIHPSLSLVCFMGTWDGVSQEVVPKLLKVVHEIALPGVTLTMIGVNQQLQDKVDLIEFYHVQGIPTILFLSRGTELGRIVGQPEESVEALFLDIVRKGDFL
jgi:hypothetical protein